MMMDNIADALNSHGLSFISQHLFEQAAEFLREAIRRDSTHADAWSNLGVALFMQNKFADAVETLRRACILRPDHTETLVTYGHSLWRTGSLIAARQAFERSNPPPDKELALLCWRLGDIDTACHHALAALRNDPNCTKMHDVLVNVYRIRGDEAAALAECEILVRLDPSFRYKCSHVMLTFGSHAGWKEHEECYLKRGHRDLLIQLRQDQPYWFCKLFDKKWDGQHTGHLLVSAEQGFGDIIQFLRYIPLAASRCEELTLVLPPTLRRLANLSLKESNVKITGKLPHEFDHYCLIMSLGYLLDGLDNIPTVPYMVAPDGCDLSSLSKPKIGLVWAGRQDHEEDHHRSISPQFLRPLLDLPMSWVSLQFPGEQSLPIIQPRQPEDWADTAALIQQLDLVIAVDTAVAHLAGALGKPVWMLNRYNTDWRWMLHRSDTPWYPSMRIFRQPSIGDWESVVTTVTRAIGVEFCQPVTRPHHTDQ